LYIKKIWEKEKLPILCGGTGFYIDAVIDGIVFPKVPPNIKLRKELSKKTADGLFHILKKLDTTRAKDIDAKNPLDCEILFIGVNKPNNILKKRIELRLLKRLHTGMLHEVEKLHKSGVSWKKLESFGLEYKWCAKYLQKKITHKEMITGLLRDINRYAKRQMTWFKRNKKIVWIKNKKEAINLIKLF